MSRTAPRGGFSGAPRATRRDPARMIDAGPATRLFPSRRFQLSTKPVTVAPPIASVAAPAPAVAPAAARAPATAPAPALAPAPARVTRGARSERPWRVATPWLLGAVLLLAAWLAWFVVDLQEQLREPGLRVEELRQPLAIVSWAVVALLVLGVALAARWMLASRQERASRSRAEQLVAMAEAERARAEAADREKGRFLGMLSHELLTPLQSIWSTIDVIESRGRIESTDPSFRRLKESTRSLRGRISDLLDFAKMSSGRLETRIRGFQLDKLIDSALRDVEEALAERNLDVHWDAGPELAQRLYSDPARLRQVIDNLLTNAIKYTERGGITIVAELAPEKGWLRVEVSDTGVGIEPQAMARLFEPFYRSPATAGMAEGSGLGLAVVRSLVDLMGGTIRFDSHVGQGTVATVEVPITEGSEGLVVDAPPRIDTRLPVLVVDDSRDARRAIADVIRSLGVTVVEAVDGRSGLAAAAAGEFQAIFLDLQMPDLSGVEVAQQLRQPGERHAQTFLALISAYNDQDDATLDGLFDARTDKPVSRRDLVTMLGRAAAQTGQAGQATR